MEPRHLGSRCPPAAWEAYLVVGIFPEGERLRWCKVHAFVGRARPGWRCVSAVEALDGPGEMVALVAGADGIRKHARPLDAASLGRSAQTWDLAAPGLAWSGFPETRLVLDAPRVEATVTVRDVAWWARIPRLLSYFTGFGPLAWNDDAGAVRGVALVEHAWGADVPLDVAALAPRRWQWDVLATADGAAMASLTLAGVGVRTMGRPAAGEPFATGWRARVRVREWSHQSGRRVPARWEGVMTTAAGTLRYEARASTDVADMVPAGGFIGCTWEGTWQDRPQRPLNGTGFTEYRAAD